MTVTIENLRYLPLSKEFEATVIERDKDGLEVSKIVAASGSLLRLCDIIAPSHPDNL